MHIIRACLFSAWLAFFTDSHGAELRLGMVGIDTGHAVAFTKILHDRNAKGHVPGARVVGAYKAWSPDIKNSRSSVEKYSEQLRTEFGVKIYDTIEELARNVDGILIESIDGRAHLRLAQPAIRAGKPVYIDKPMAASLNDARTIFALAREHKVPVFSASSLRFARGTQAVRNGSIGRVLRVETNSPAHLEPTHPDLFWYGIHGVEALFTVMGAGIDSVMRRETPAGTIEVEGRWKDGRVGVFREARSYGGRAVGEKGEAVVGTFDGYAPLVAAIVVFFQTGKSPVPEQETLEILAFMEADALSKTRGGASVKIAELMKRETSPSAP